MLLLEQPTPAFLPGESQGQGSLVGCRPQGRTESGTTEATQQQQQQQQVKIKIAFKIQSLLSLSQEQQQKNLF